MTIFVGYWDDLREMPKDGPFVLCGGPVGASVARVEHARGPDGIGCPVVLHLKLRKFLEEKGLPMRGHKAADMLNDMYAKGELVWDKYDTCSLVPKGTENIKNVSL